MNMNDFPDTNPDETAEWRDAFEALLGAEGPQRARFILDQLAHRARDPQVAWSPERVTPYVNTIPVDRQPAFPGDLAIEERLGSLMRWNALAMVPGPMPLTVSWVGTLPATPAQPICLKSVSTISSMPATRRMAAIWCFSSPTAPPACTPVPTWKGA